MDIQELYDSAKTETSERFKMKLSDFVRQHPQFSNLNSENKKIIFDLIYKHIDAIRQGRGISGYIIEHECRDLYDKRLELKLTPKDLDDIKDIVNLFKQ